MREIQAVQKHSLTQTIEYHGDWDGLCRKNLGLSSPATFCTGVILDEVLSQMDAHATIQSKLTSGVKEDGLKRAG